MTARRTITTQRALPAGPARVHLLTERKWSQWEDLDVDESEGGPDSTEPLRVGSASAAVTVVMQ